MEFFLLAMFLGLFGWSLVSAVYLSLIICRCNGLERRLKKETTYIRYLQAWVDNYHERSEDKPWCMPPFYRPEQKDYGT